MQHPTFHELNGADSLPKLVQCPETNSMNVTRWLKFAVFERLRFLRDSGSVSGGLGFLLAHRKMYCELCLHYYFPR